MLDPADEPVGAWAEAIRHLEEAMVLMDQMNFHGDREDFTVGQVCRPGHMTALRAIRQHYRTTYLVRAPEALNSWDCKCNCHMLGMGRPQDESCGHCGPEHR